VAHHQFLFAAILGRGTGRRMDAGRAGEGRRAAMGTGDGVLELGIVQVHDENEGEGGQGA